MGEFFYTVLSPRSMLHPAAALLQGIASMDKPRKCIDIHDCGFYAKKYA